MSEVKPGPVEFVSRQHFVHAKIVDGALICSTHLDSGDDEFHEAALAHCGESGPVTGVELTTTFALTSVLDNLIEGHELFESPGVTHIGGKPAMDALKQELEEMLERISQIKYSEPEKVVP